MEFVRRLAAWAYAQEVEPLAEDAVPGTTVEERRALSAAGGIARALAGPRIEEWPAALRLWAKTAPEPPSDQIDDLGRHADGDTDALAVLYEAIVSGRNRRRLGTFFTPAPVVDFMLDTAEGLLGCPRVVIDPGAGVGAFSIAAKRRWPTADVYAVDVNVATLGLLAARPGADVNLVHEDFLAWALGSGVPAPGPRLWIGNPPYTRHQELASGLKNAASEAAQELVTSGLAGLSAYFLAATLRALAPDDAMCLVLPGSWTEARYGKPLRAALRDLVTRQVRLSAFGTEVIVFPGTRVTAMVVAVGPEEERPQRFLTAPAHLTATAVTTGREIERSRLDGAVEGLGSWLWPRKRTSRENTVALSEFGRVRRGVATGANEFFFLSADARSAYPTQATVRAIRRLRKVDGHHLTEVEHDRLARLGERCWLLKLDDPALLDDPAVQAWVTKAQSARVPERYLTSNRDPWYELEIVQAPDLVVSPMGKSRMRAVVNDVGAIHSNALYGVYLDGDTALATRMVTWLNGPVGQAALLERARTYGAGLFKLEPKDVLALRVPRSLVLAPNEDDGEVDRR